MAGAAAPAPARNDRAVAVRPEQEAVIAFQRELDKRRAAIESSAAKLIDPERFMGIVLSTFTRTPKLWECDPVTVARAVVEAAQLGLEPTGLMGGSYLVPFYSGKSKRMECQLIVGYRGLADLARRSGEILIVEAEVVRAGDEFDYERGLSPRLVHRPALVGDRGAMTHVYAIARYRTGETQFDVMDEVEVELIKARSKSRDRDGNLTGPWVTDYFEMSKKTVVRRMSKLLPLSVEARRAIQAEDDWEGEGRETRNVTPPRTAPQRSRIAARVIGDPATTTGGAAAAETAPREEHDGTGPSSPVPAAGPAPESTGDDGAGDAAMEAQPARCGVFDATKGRCVREADHPGNHQNADRESWG